MTIEQALSDLVSRGRAAWPELPVSSEEISRAATERAPGPEAISKLHAEDLHLAVACALGVRGAIEAFDAAFLSSPPLRAALRRIDPSPSFADEVRQAVRERLFTPAPGRIVEYSARGALGAFTRVVAMRIALDLRPRQPPQQRSVEPQRDPELRFLQQKYGRQFEEALAAAFARLDAEQGNLLKLQIVDGLGTAQIAKLFRVDRSTIKRRLAACRATLLEETQLRLREQLGLSPQSFESLARLLTSQLHLSVARLLKERE